MPPAFHVGLVPIDAARCGPGLGRRNPGGSFDLTGQSLPDPSWLRRPVTQDDAPLFCTVKARTARGFCENLATNLRSPPDGASGAFTGNTARTKRRNERLSIGLRGLRPTDDLDEGLAALKRLFDQVLLSNKLNRHSSNRGAATVHRAAARSHASLRVATSAPIYTSARADGAVVAPRAKLPAGVEWRRSTGRA